MIQRDTKDIAIIAGPCSIESEQQIHRMHKQDGKIHWLPSCLHLDNLRADFVGF